MDTLKKLFPLSFKAKKDLGALIVNILIYLVIGIIAGVLIGIVALIRIVISILNYLKILK